MAKSKVKKVEELSPVEINRDITKVSNIIKKSQNPKPRDIITAGKQVTINDRDGYVNRIDNNFIYVEMLDNPGEIEKFEIKKALKSYKPKKAKNIVFDTSINGPSNPSVAKEPKENDNLVGLKMEKFINEYHNPNKIIDSPQLKKDLAQDPDASTVECVALSDLRNLLDQAFGEDKTAIFMEQIKKSSFVFKTLSVYMAKNSKYLEL